MQARKDFIARVAISWGFLSRPPSTAPEECRAAYLPPHSSVQCDYCCREGTKIHADHGFLLFGGSIAVAYLGCVDELTVGAKKLLKQVLEKLFIARALVRENEAPIEIEDLIVKALVLVETDIRDCAPGAVIHP